MTDPKDDEGSASDGEKHNADESKTEAEVAEPKDATPGDGDEHDDDGGEAGQKSTDDDPPPATDDAPADGDEGAAATSTSAASGSAALEASASASASDPAPSNPSDNPGGEPSSDDPDATAPLAESRTRRLVALLDPPDDRPPDADDDLLCLGFNQDGGCLAVGTSSGFRICNVCPFGETFRRTMGAGGGGVEGEEGDDPSGGGAVSGSVAGGGGGGIGRISMLYRTNLLALVGGGPSPRYPPNKVLVWDDRLHRPIGELSFRKAVLNVLLRRDRVCVALRDRVYVYDFADLRLLDCVETGDNPRGLVCISTSAGGGGGGGGIGGGGGAMGGWGGGGGANGGGGGGMVLACPGIPKGQVRVELYGYRKTLLIDAHDGNIAAIALTVDGTYLATASEKGTVIRMFDTGLPRGGRYNGAASATAAAESGTPLREFRRGVERARVTCLAFSLDGKWLGCASDRGTVHVFRASDEEEEEAADRHGRRRSDRKKKSSSSFASPTKLASKLLPGVVSHSKRYFMEGEGSYAQVRGVPDPRACAFVPDRPDTVAVAGLDEYGNGCLLIAGFGPGGGGGGGGGGGPSAGGEVGGSTTAGGGGGSSSGEPTRVGYHRFFRKAPLHSIGGGRSGRTGHGGGDGKKGKTKRTTSRSAGLGNRYPEEEGGDGAGGMGLYMDSGDAAAGIARGMNDIVFGDEDAYAGDGGGDDDEEGFVNVDTEGGGGGGGGGGPGGGSREKRSPSGK